MSGFIIPVPENNKSAYKEMADKMADFFMGCGALQVMEGWEADVPDGRQTDMRKAVAAKAGEKIVFSWVIWPNSETSKQAETKMQDDGFAAMFTDMPFDGARMIMGGFDVMLSRIDETITA